LLHDFVGDNTNKGRVSFFTTAAVGVITNSLHKRWLPLLHDFVGDNTNKGRVSFFTTADVGVITNSLDERIAYSL
jgi:hypothetical protein